MGERGHRKKNLRKPRERRSAGEEEERTLFKAVGVRGSGRATGYVL